MSHAYIERLVNLLNPAENLFLNMTTDEAEARLASGDAEQLQGIAGQFALVHKEGQRVRMARSIGRPLRYFLAKRAEGPCLVTAERIDEIFEFLEAEGLGNQFHPSYTRMVPAHHLLELQLIGCPDPSPTLTRFVTPATDKLPADLDVVGTTYIGTVAAALDAWLDRVPSAAPLGVLFSGGVDSGSIFLLLYHALRRRGQSPARLKAFTLAVEGSGEDVEQARRFLQALDLELFLEPIVVPRDALDFKQAIRLIEDYKPLDVQSATMARALCGEIRERYPDWKYLVDGDGGDENLKDYPIEENPELTIRSVLNNPLLYQEGWGVSAVKHSLTYSGGQSRGHVRTFAPARQYGFSGFSPYALPEVVAASTRIPFIELTDWDHERLYALKGEIVRRGVAAITGLTMPVFEKRRFQHGAVGRDDFESLFPRDEQVYRHEFAALYE